VVAEVTQEPLHVVLVVGRNVAVHAVRSGIWATG
jgi:hypothetical protein